MNAPRVRSGGQTGVDRAALEAAAVVGLEYEGWCPKGGWAEDFPDPPGVLARYGRLIETPSAAPEQRTEWNVRDSAITIVLVPSREYSSPGTELTIRFARSLDRLCFVLDFSENTVADALRGILCKHQDATSINVAGPRESECPGAYRRCLSILVAAFSCLVDAE